MNTVCGQAQPQKRRPKATVNKATKMMKVMKPITKIRKSCGQNTWPKNTKRRSRILIISTGSPLMRRNGTTNNSTNNE